jgi:hypothetical protein
MDEALLRATVREALFLLSVENSKPLFKRSASRKLLGAFTIQTGSTPQGNARNLPLVAAFKAGDKGIA